MMVDTKNLLFYWRSPGRPDGLRWAQPAGSRRYPDGPGVPTILASTLNCAASVSNTPGPDMSPAMLDVCSNGTVDGKRRYATGCNGIGRESGWLGHRLGIGGDRPCSAFAEPPQCRSRW